MINSWLSRLDYITNYNASAYTDKEETRSQGFLFFDIESSETITALTLGDPGDEDRAKTKSFEHLTNTYSYVKNAQNFLIMDDLALVLYVDSFLHLFINIWNLHIQLFGSHLYQTLISLSGWRRYQKVKTFFKFKKRKKGKKRGVYYFTKKLLKSSYMYIKKIHKENQETACLPAGKNVITNNFLKKISKTCS